MARQLRHKPDHFQQQAIDSTARGIRIVAPAGSGKSETLARRIAKRIEQDGINPRRILVLTFDNAAKKSLTGFFSDLLDRKQMPTILTFNALGNRILKNYFPQEIATLPNAGGGQEYRDLRRKFDSRGYDFPVLTWDGVPRTLTDTFNSLKNQGFYPGRPKEREKQTNWLRDEYLRLPREGESTSLDEYWGMPSSTPSDENYSTQLSDLLDAFVEFDLAMRELGRMDYEDQKARAVEQLRRSTTVCAKLQDEFDEIVVDECQDISRLDAMLVFYTAGKDTLVVLAGDDDQTLYEFRNAHSLYLRHPEIVFKDLAFETVHLDLNYRSPQAILGPAINLISHNVERIEKSPSSAVTRDGEVEVRPLGSTHTLNTDLVTEIQKEIAAGRNPEDIAVLCHARAERDMIKPIENALRRAGVPVVEVSSNEQEVTKPGVWVRSFLKAKGRQWPVVFIPAVNDREVPDTESIRKGELESIRRRFYVAMTRASEKLVFSYVRGGDTDRIDLTAEGEVVGTNGASRFLFEAGLVKPVVEETVAVEQPTSQQAEPQPETATPEPVMPDSTPEVTSPKPEKQEAKAEESVAAQETPAPVVAPEPPKKRLKPKLWEPYADDTRRMAKARSEWEIGDYDDAIRNAWKPVEAALTRLVKLPPYIKTNFLVERINLALENGVIDFKWQERLHLWRRVRNQAEHPEDDKKQFTQSQMQDFGFQMVDGVGEFFTHLAERNAPKQMVMETQDEFLHKLGNLVSQIQQGRPSPIHNKPLKAIRFNPETDKFNILAMQLLMVLRDVRFYVPEEYRWSSSALISKFSVDKVGYLPGEFRTQTGNRMKMQPGEEQNQLLDRFSRMVDQECGDSDPKSFLIERLTNAMALENGNFHSGLKLNPRARI